MYALCVPGAVNTQCFVWKFFYALYKKKSFIDVSQTFSTCLDSHGFICRTHPSLEDGWFLWMCTARSTACVHVHGWTVK